MFTTARYGGADRGRYSRAYAPRLSHMLDDLAVIRRLGEEVEANITIASITMLQSTPKWTR
jgi:hypothetical protein